MKLFLVPKDRLFTNRSEYQEVILFNIHKSMLPYFLFVTFVSHFKLDLLGG